MVIKATTLRQNLYQLLDKVLETGQPLIVERNGKRIQIIAEEKSRKLDRLENHNSINGDPELLLNPDWSDYWNEISPTKTKVKKTKRT